MASFLSHYKLYPYITFYPFTGAPGALQTSARQEACAAVPERAQATVPQG